MPQSSSPQTLFVAKDKLIHRFFDAVAWRREKVLRSVRCWLTFRGAARAIGWRWPWPLKKPWQRSRLRLVSHGGGIGDELLCTPIFREIRRRNPGCRVTFVSRHADIFRTNPHLDAVEPFSLAAARGATYLQYNAVLPPPRPLLTLMAECVGLSLVSDRLEPPAVEPSPELRARVAALAGPRIVIQPQASHWTPNKQWPIASWKRLAALLVERFEVIEVGTQSLMGGEDFGPRFHSFAGTTSMQEFAWTISQAAVFVGPPSGGMHFANAYQIPTVAILGGYEAPDGYNYPWAKRFFTPVECAPCWLTTPCPYDLKCLRVIRPEDVHEAVVKAAESGVVPKS